MFKQLLFSDRDLYGDLAGVLCDITREVLWEGTRAWVLERNPAASFSARVGTGKKTCCYSHDGNFIITYGRLMVGSQYDPNRARFWTHGKEILERGYFKGRLELPELLAQVTCHEYAHLVQVIKGWRYHGGMHPPEFYKILDRMHDGGAADLVFAELQSRCAAADIPLEFFEEKLPERSVADFTEGDTVWFRMRDGHIAVGRVSERRRKRLLVTLESGAVHNVHPVLLTPGLPPDEMLR